MLAGADSLQFIEAYQEVVRQRHFLIELVREVQVVQEILAQMRRQQTLEEGGLSAALSSNERRHNLIAVQGVHLQPMGHTGTQPDAEKILLFCADTRQATEQLRYMVLSVPLGQVVEIIANGVIRANLFRMNKLHDIRLWIGTLADVLALGTKDNAVQRFLRQRTENRFLPFGRLSRKLHLPVQLVATEQVVLVQKLLSG